MTLEPLEGETFSIESEASPERLQIALRGHGDLDAIEPLGQYLDRAFDEVVATGVGRVVFDFTDLEFMNSSCFKAFVTFIDRTRERGEPSIVFVTEPNHRWQRRSLEALRRLAMGIVSIEQVGLVER